MKQKHFNQVSEFTLTQLTSLVDSIEKEKSVFQRNMIKQDSPFSDEITQSISTYEELLVYCSLELSEATVTRRSLIRKIDYNLFVTSKEKTNLELMRGGHPPYAYDADDGVIELHHIGQDKDGPFAELTHSEHMMHGNSQKLHRDAGDSWRNEANSEASFSKERSNYWKKRAKGEVDILFLSSPLPTNYRGDLSLVNGTYTSNGEKRQRYICNECGRSFTLMQNSIISESNLSFATWITLIVCLYQGLSIAETANICGISEKSVQSNRLRLFYALKILDEKVKLWGKIVIDETYFPVNFKGNHSGSKDFAMGRKAHKRGSENHTRGLSKEQVCVICALDEYGNSVARVAGVGAPNVYSIKYALNDSIDKENVICLFSDMNPTIRRYANDNGMLIKQTKSKKDRRKARTPASLEKSHWLQKMNSFHSKLKKYMNRYSGISSDMLYGYLCLFTWKCRNQDRDPVDAYRELFEIMIQPNLYRPINEIALLPCFCNVTIPRRKEPYIKYFKRDMIIFAKYAAGVPVKKIAGQYKLSRARVYKILDRVEKLGYGYETEKEKKYEERLSLLEAPRPPHTCKTSERNKQIYKEKIAWNGSNKEFYSEMTQKYGLSKQSIMNIISKEKRTMALSDNLTVLDTFTYRELSDIYQDVYDDYLEGVMNGKPKAVLVEDLAKKYKYGIPNIQRIISIMKSNDHNVKKQYKKKAGPDVINRDKELFVALLNWDGTPGEFAIWAQEKYGLSIDYIKSIITLHYKANPKRYYMIHP